MKYSADIGFHYGTTLLSSVFFFFSQDSLSSYDSFNNNNQQKQSRIIPNAHDDLKTTLSKIEPGSPNVQNNPQRNRWDQTPQQHRHERLGSKLDLKYVMPPSVESLDQSPRNSTMEHTDRSSVERDQQQQQYRYSRSPAKQTRHVETKTDYGKYSRNNSSAQDYARSSHQDLTQAHLSVPPMKNGYEGAMQSPQNTYKPVPPPKPKNYKPPYKGQPPPGYGGGGEGMMQPPLPYQHGKSHSNPVVSTLNFTLVSFLSELST